MIKKALFNFLKIIGASWGAFGISALSVMILRFMRISPRMEYFIDAILGGIFAAVILYVMVFREEYKERKNNSSVWEQIIPVGLPAFLHMVLCVVTKGSFYIMVTPSLMTVAWANMETEKVTHLQVFFVALVFDCIYAASIWLGSFFGKKKRVKDREMLCGNPIDHKE